MADRRTSLSPHLRDRARTLLAGRGLPRALSPRRVAATALILLAVALTLRPPGEDPGRTVPVLVAAHDLAAGSALTERDVRTADAPAVLRPASALAGGADVTGRIVAAGVAAGEPITPARLVGPENTRLVSGTPGAVAVPVRLADPAVADLLRPGSRVDVVASGEHDGTAELLAGDCVVVTVRDDGPGPGRGADAGRLVLIALPAETATRVAAVSLARPVTVTLR